MAGSSLLALIDDIATVLDDISVMTKVAARKTAAVLGDDLALNAQQVAGVRADREIPVVWAVSVGSLKNKAILVPAALLISAIAPWAITPLLMVGGAYLCYEGFEKVAHHVVHGREANRARQADLVQALANTRTNLVAFETDKIKGAVRTDFVLSAEIIVITLGTVADAGFMSQIVVLSTIALVMTAGVYGLVAGIVKLDDAGLWLSRRQGEHRWATAQRWAGRRLVTAAPRLMKMLSVLGTAAMFLVGGGILMHGLPWAYELVHGVSQHAAVIPGIGAVLAGAAPGFANVLAGVAAGAIAFAATALIQRMARFARANHP